MYFNLCKKRLALQHSNTCAGASFDSRLSSIDLVRGVVAGGPAGLIVSEEATSSETFGRGSIVGEADSDGVDRGEADVWTESDGMDCSGCCAGVSPGGGTHVFSSSSSAGFTGVPGALTSALMAGFTAVPGTLTSALLLGFPAVPETLISPLLAANDIGDAATFSCILQCTVTDSVYQHIHTYTIHT